MCRDPAVDRDTDKRSADRHDHRESDEHAPQVWGDPAPVVYHDDNGSQVRDPKRYMFRVEWRS